MSLNRRQFLATTAATLGAAYVSPLRAEPAAKAAHADSVAFFLIGDTHFLANKERPEEMDATSAKVCGQMIDWLNKLPGREIPAAAGGGAVGAVRGVIHAGDLIDSGDKADSVHEKMQGTEWRAFQAEFGLTGKEGRLQLPVYEIHGNHDAPRGTGLVIDGITERNKQRTSVANRSANGLHYSWDWGPVHFVNLGIVVGAEKTVARPRRYAPLDSLDFLQGDLQQHARDKSRPVILTHHVDVARYSGACDLNAAPTGNPEWDACDVHAYHEALKDYNIVAIQYGHTHVRNVYKWDGTRDTKGSAGIGVFNTAKVSHFASQTQALMYCETTATELVVREFATKDQWTTADWTPFVWRVPLQKVA